MNVQVLCTTMLQKDLTKYEEMNIQTDVVFANQDDRQEYRNAILNGNNVEMITTPYRGVGKNRNMALLHASGDILLFSDDDVRYKDGYPEAIKEAFRQAPEADAILFNISQSKDEASGRINKGMKRVTFLNVLNYGMPRIAIRKKSWEKANLWVTTLFGGGSRYCGGEDNLFLVQALKMGIKIYTHPFNLGSLADRESSWFRGIDKKYFFDNGAFLEAAFPLMKHPFAWYFALKFVKKSDLNLLEAMKWQYRGMKAFGKGLGFDEWEEKTVDRQ